MIIVHRVNRIAQLRRIPTHRGVEVDLRESGGTLILRHDPGDGGDRFADYLLRFRHRFLVVNPKCDGLEEEAIGLLRRHRIRDYFLVDLPMPAVARLVARGERRIALRISELEPVDACLPLRDKVDWIWVDGFARYPAFGDRERRLLEGKRFCLVSPELHGRPGVSPREARRLARKFGAEAVCTDSPGRWAPILEEDVR